jgi:hypothetical protein
MPFLIGREIELHVLRINAKSVMTKLRLHNVYATPNDIELLSIS